MSAPDAHAPGPRAALARRVTWIALVAGCAFALHANTLELGFVYDDADQVLGNPWIRDPGSIGTILTSGSWDYVGVRSNYYRPVMHLAYMAVHSAFGLWAPGYHLLNVALHSAVSVLVLLLAAHLLERGGPPGRTRPALAAAAGLLFAAHPIHTEAVAWIGGIPDLCFTLFGLASLYLYATSPAERIPSLGPRYVGSLVAFLLAALSKETALVLPGLLLAYDLAFRRGTAGVGARLKGYLPFAAIAVLYVVLRVNALGSFAPVSRHAQLTAYEIVLNVGPLLAAYLGKLALPVNLSAFHPFAPVGSILEPRALGAAGLLAVTGALGAVLLARRNARAFLAWALVVLPLLPVLYVPALGENPFAERYLYLPSAGFVLALVLAAERGLAAFPRPVAAFPVACAAVLGGYSAGTVARNPAWRSDLTLWQDAARKAPGSALVHYNLGAALQESGQRELAIAAYARAIELRPSAVAYNNLGVLYRERGATGKALEVLQQALRSDPRYAPAHSNLALAYLDLGLVEPAVDHLRTAVQLAPDQAAYLNNLGHALESAGRRDEAIRSYEAALRIDPGNAAARRNLAELLGARR